VLLRQHRELGTERLEVGVTFAKETEVVLIVRLHGLQGVTTALQGNIALVNSVHELVDGILVAPLQGTCERHFAPGVLKKKTPSSTLLKQAKAFGRHEAFKKSPSQVNKGGTARTWANRVPVQL
jgi:hypothetical protein